MGCHGGQDSYRTNASRPHRWHPRHRGITGGQPRSGERVRGTWAEETAKSSEDDLDWISEKAPVLATTPVPEEKQERREKDTPYYDRSTYQSLAAKTMPIREAMKIPEAKAALEKEWKKLFVVACLVGRDCVGTRRGPE